MYQNIVFDLYGTLVDIRTADDSPEVFRRLAKFYTFRGAAYRPGELQSAFHSYMDAQVRERAGSVYRGTGETIAFPEIDVVPIFRRLFEDRGVAADDREAELTANWYRIIATRRLRVYPGVFELFRALRECGKGIYLLSNAQRAYTAGELKTTGLEPWFDGILISSDYGCRKPDRIFFGELTRQFGIDPGASLMVGNDAGSDIAGAAAAGMDSVLLATDQALAAPAGGAESTYTIADGDFRRIARLPGVLPEHG
ncbi:MAG: HAD family hydrolase [Lachnospiraceae bacterium]|nr:HAD family hydrolase [Lachnospiraceae bacterium]